MNVIPFPVEAEVVSIERAAINLERRDAKAVVKWWQTECRRLHARYFVIVIPDAALTAVSIMLEWCKGHVGIIGNERADELSLMGREAVLALQPDPLDLIREQLDYSARGWD